MQCNTKIRNTIKINSSIGNGAKCAGKGNMSTIATGVVYTGRILQIPMCRENVRVNDKTHIRVMIIFAGLHT